MRPPYYKIPDYVAPAVEGRTVACKLLLPGGAAHKFAFLTIPDALAEPFRMQDVKTCQYDVKSFPTWFSYGVSSRNECTTACPVFRGPLIYCRAERTLYCIDAR